MRYVRWVAAVEIRVDVQEKTESRTTKSNHMTHGNVNVVFSLHYITVKLIICIVLAYNITDFLTVNDNSFEISG